MTKPTSSRSKISSKSSNTRIWRLDNQLRDDIKSMSLKMAEYLDSANYWKEKAENKQISHTESTKKSKLNAEEKYEKLKKINAELELKSIETDRIVADLKIKYKKYHTDLQSVTAKISEIRTFFSEHLQFVNSVVKEVSIDKRYMHIHRKLLDFQKKFDKLSISLNSFSMTKTVGSTREVSSNEKPALKNSSVKRHNQSIERVTKPLSRNNSILSTKSKKSVNLNRSNASLNRSNYSNTKGSVTRRSRNGSAQKIITEDDIQDQIEKIQKEIERLKGQYQNILFQSGKAQQLDPLCREKMNFFTQEIHLKTKKLLELRKKQKILFEDL